MTTRPLVPEPWFEDDLVPTKGRRSGMTPEAIIALRRKNYTILEIAEHFGVKKQAVSQMAHRYGITLQPTTKRQIAMRDFPWKVARPLQDCNPYKRMADHVDFKANGRDSTLDERRLRDLESFYRKLEVNDWVIEYDPTIEPSPEVKCGGWRYVPRQPGDGDMMIRVNQHTVALTPEREALWCIPLKGRPLGA